MTTDLILDDRLVNHHGTRRLAGRMAARGRAAIVGSCIGVGIRGNLSTSGDRGKQKKKEERKRRIAQKPPHRSMIETTCFLYENPACRAPQSVNHVFLESTNFPYESKGIVVNTRAAVAQEKQHADVLRDFD